jgi:TetR/AcrR family fatty acid metabolism transcriptional regulator
MPHTRATATDDPREVKRSRILRAAIEVFAHKGYFTARMTDIAHEAEVADGTLYLYFDGKEHLLMSIFDDVLSRFVDRLRSELEDVDDPQRKLEILIRLHLEALCNDRSLAQVLQIEMRHSRRFMSLLTRGRLGEYLTLLRQIIEDGCETGRLRRDLNPVLATNLVFGAVDEMVNSWLLSDEPGDLLRHHQPLVDLLFQGMAPHGHAEGGGR